MSAICVQNFDDSLSPAIHTRYRISLRSSSLREPRYPLLRVVYGFHSGQGALALSRIQMYCSVCENELMKILLKLIMYTSMFKREDERECDEPPSTLACRKIRCSLAPTYPAQTRGRGTFHQEKDSQRWIWIGCQ